MNTTSFKTTSSRSFVGEVSLAVVRFKVVRHKNSTCKNAGQKPPLRITTGQLPEIFPRFPGLYIYSGLLLSMAATVMTIGTVYSVGGYVLLLGALIFKLASEERLLAYHFGPVYKDYQKRVKALIPGVV
jgi:hypothetical protein